MRPRKRRAARGGERDQHRSDQVGGRDDLHVAVLAHVEVTAAEGAPTDEDVGGALHHALAGDDALAVVGVGARVGVRLVDRGSGLLALQEQGIGPGASGEEHQVDDHAHAAHPDHLADHVDGSEAVEERPAVLLERGPVAPEKVVDDVALLVVVDGDPQRGLGGDAGPAVRLVANLANAPRLVFFCLPFSITTLTWPRSAGSKKSTKFSALMPSYQMSISGRVA